MHISDRMSVRETQVDVRWVPAADSYMRAGGSSYLCLNVTTRFSDHSPFELDASCVDAATAMGKVKMPSPSCDAQSQGRHRKADLYLNGTLGRFGRSARNASVGGNKRGHNDDTMISTSRRWSSLCMLRTRLKMIRLFLPRTSRENSI